MSKAEYKIPVSEKRFLSLRETASYLGTSYNKMREIVNDSGAEIRRNGCVFVDKERLNFYMAS